MQRQLEGVVSKVLPSAWARARYWRYSRVFSEEEQMLLPALCDQGAIGVDVGAARGAYALRLARLGMQVIAFEARTEASYHLQTTANILDLPVVVHPMALSDRFGLAQFRIAPMDTGRSTLETSNDLRGVAGPVSTHFVATVPLDAFELSDVGLIKIDVEGHEVAVLEGARSTLELNMPSVIVEVEDRHNPGAVDSVQTMLSTLGYHGFFLRDETLWPISTFDLEKHQDQANIGDVTTGYARTATYINNFLFIHHAELSRRLADIAKLGISVNV